MLQSAKGALENAGAKIALMGARSAGYVLVGGRSSRFGSDKALALWEGKPLAARVAETVRAAAGSAVLVGSPEKYGQLGFAVIDDAVRDFGPLAGILAALEHSSADWNLMVACDMPHLTAEFLRFLLETAAASGAELLLPLDRDGRPEPLCAVYASGCRAAISEAVSRGVRKVTEAFAALQVREMPFAGYAAFDRDGLLFANLNTPADLASARTGG